MQKAQRYAITLVRLCFPALCSRLMLILAIEQSTVRGSAAILEDDRIIGSTSWDETGLRNRNLFARTPALLKKASLRIRDIEMFAIGLGPGRFSGLRISLSAVMGMAQPGGRPVYGLQSTDALAWQYGRARPGRRITVVGDARRNTLWYADYEIEGQKLNQLTPLSLVSCDKAAEAFCLPGTIATSEWDRLRTLLQGCAPSGSLVEENVYPAAADIGILVRKRTNRDIPSAPLSPIYMHPPVRQPVTP